MRPVFEAFRKAVLALDPCVSEEFLKLYVAYKAETNFVDVVPQAKRCAFAQHALCRCERSQRTLQGCHGMAVGERRRRSRPLKLDELPYVIGLVRQS